MPDGGRQPGLRGGDRGVRSLFKIRIIGLVAPRTIEIGRRPVLFVEGELVTTGAIRNLLVTLGAVALATACAHPAAAAPPQGGV
jgi:hypothetical protein